MLAVLCRQGVRFPSCQLQFSRWEREGGRGYWGVGDTGGEGVLGGGGLGTKYEPTCNNTRMSDVIFVRDLPL